MNALSIDEMRHHLAIEAEWHKRESQRSLASFIRHGWHVVEPANSYVHGWHIDAIAEHLEAVTKGQIRDLIINMPPRHMKSLAVGAFWPAWEWGPYNKPQTRWLFSSYADSLSIRDSVKCRQIIQSSWFQSQWGNRFRLAQDQNEKSKFLNDRSGHRIATSVGGRGTGEGGDRIVVDDPHKVMEAESDTTRENVIDWWKTEMSSRGNDPRTVAKVIVMQRIHESDLSGEMLAEGGYEHLKLPAEYETPKKKHFTSIGWTDPRKVEGELLWPQRFGKPELTKLKRALGSRATAGQLQQRPSPADGDIVERGWFKYYTALPPIFEFMALACDLKFKKTQTGAYNTFQVWGRIGARKYLIAQVRDRTGFTAQLNTVAALREQYPQLNAIWIEDAANAQAVKDVLQKKIPGLILVPPGGEKVVRAQATAPSFEAGDIWLPDPSICAIDEETGAPWIENFVEEWIKVPNGTLWDQVDASGMAIRMLATAEPDDFILQAYTKPGTFR